MGRREVICRGPLACLLEEELALGPMMSQPRERVYIRGSTTHHLKAFDGPKVSTPYDRQVAEGA